MLSVRKTFFTDITCSLLLWGVGLATGRKTSQPSSSIKGLFFLAASRTRMQDFTVLSAVLSLGFFQKTNKTKNRKPRVYVSLKNPKLQGAWFWTCVHRCNAYIYTYMLFLSLKTKVNKYYSHRFYAIIWIFKSTSNIVLVVVWKDCIKNAPFQQSFFFYHVNEKEAWMGRKSYRSMYIYNLFSSTFQQYLASFSQSETW